MPSLDLVLPVSGGWTPIQGGGCQDCQVLHNSQYLLVCAQEESLLHWQEAPVSVGGFLCRKGSQLCSLCVLATCPLSLRFPSTVPLPILWL